MTREIQRHWQKRQRHYRGGTAEGREQIQPYFSEPIPGGETAGRSIRLYLAIKKILAQERLGFLWNSSPFGFVMITAPHVSPRA